MPTLTTNYGLQKPLVNSATDQDLWGGELNTDMDEIDGLIKTGINFSTSAKTATFAVTAPTVGTTATGDSNTYFLCNATSGVMAPTLPAASTTGNGFTVAFKKTDSSTNAVTITPNGTDKIDGAASLVLSIQAASYILVSDNVSNWSIFADNASTANLAPINSPTFTGVPAGPTAAVNTSTTQLATTAFVNPASLIAANGYVTLASGLIIQWGPTGTVASSRSSTPITFPLAFPNAFFVGFSNANDGPSGNVYRWNAQSGTLTGMNIIWDFANSGLTNVAGWWLAIGN